MNNASSLATAAIDLVEAIEREFLARGDTDGETSWFDIPDDVIERIADRLIDVANKARAVSGPMEAA